MSELTGLPSVGVLSQDDALSAFPEKVRISAARTAIDETRSLLMAGVPCSLDEILERALVIASERTRPRLTGAINASGVIIHTGLGRARLADAAVEQMLSVAQGHSMLELDTDAGKRGDRQDHVRELLRALTGAEDALVLNNAAGGVLASLAALAAGQEVVLSRGQMVEIGGSFRMPEIVKQSGCRLTEVGCTNRTHLKDYAEAVSDQTAAFLRCHPSNYKVVGFTSEPTLKELADLAHAASLLVIDDQGSGCLVDTRRFGLPKQPTLGEAITDGADLVIASGDKLLGGPQAGLILGKADLISRIARHPLARAMRIDKLCLAALEATLRLYRDGGEMQIPTLRYLGRPLSEVEAMARSLQEQIPGSVLEMSATEVGAGCAPGEAVPTWRVGLVVDDPDKVAGILRKDARPIIGRIENDRFWIDLRTVEESEVDEILRALETFR